ncbi:MAG: 23S rRNA (uracil(1939)-C(5))-methyltransferase RlmD [Thermodesulfobacteriota bacterium]|nr:23S rRNA (uracil(1939)-C(5))-methyltransferase RlmD [Thermodesulfobacteriota bacterium]
MNIKKRKTYDLEIVDLAFGGKGLAKPDGFPIFVDRVLPGDKAVVKIIKKKENFAEGRVVSITEPSKLRQKAPCQYVDYCGGCRWQELPYEIQLEYKKRHVVESLEHIALLKDISVKDVLPSEKIFQFRNKMEFSCSDRRWLMPEEFENPDIIKDFGIGLHVPGTFDWVIDIKECHILPFPGNKILDDVRQFIKKSGLPAYGLNSHEGFWRFLMLKHSVAFNTWMVNIVTKEENNAVLVPMTEMLMEKYSEISSVVNNITASKSGVATGENEKLLAGKSFIQEKLGEYIFEISANSFFQTNTRSAEQLYSLVSHYADLSGSEKVIDLYSGTGTIPIWLSKDADRVVGIEIVESAVKDAVKNARLNNIKNCTFYTGDIKDVLPDLGKQCDVMIIDPPRVGMHKDVVEQVINIRPEKIVYVSCNPATLARDLGMLKSKYTTREVQPIDMFPHTFHIESVAVLTADRF